MEVKNKVVPNEEQMKGFVASGHDGPFCMLKSHAGDGEFTGLPGICHTQDCRPGGSAHEPLKLADLALGPVP